MTKCSKAKLDAEDGEGGDDDGGDDEFEYWVVFGTPGTMPPRITPCTSSWPRTTGRALRAPRRTPPPAGTVTTASRRRWRNSRQRPTTSTPTATDTPSDDDSFIEEPQVQSQGECGCTDLYRQDECECKDGVIGATHDGGAPYCLDEASSRSKRGMR